MAVFNYTHTIDSVFRKSAENITVQFDFQEDGRPWVGRFTLEKFDESSSSWVGKGGFSSSPWSGTTLEATCDYGTLTYNHTVTHDHATWLGDEHQYHEVIFSASSPSQIPRGKYRINLFLKSSSQDILDQTQHYIEFTISEDYGIVYVDNGSAESPVTSVPLDDIRWCHTAGIN